MKKEMTVEEARRALRELDATRTRARNMMFAEFAGFPLTLWGLIWAFCHLNGYYYPHHGKDLLGGNPDTVAKWIIWPGLAVTFIFVIAKLRYANPVRSEGSWFGRFRAPLFVVVWIIFRYLVRDLIAFGNGLQMNAFDSMYNTLLFIVYGFWMASGLFLSVGSLVCCWVLVGYHFFPEHYHLVMGLGAGGTMFVAGVASLIQCRRAKPDYTEVEEGRGV